MGGRTAKVFVKPDVLIKVRQNSGYGIVDVARKLCVKVTKVLAGLGVSIFICRSEDLEL